MASASTSTSLQNAWNDAQTSLAAIRENVEDLEHMRPRLLRVGKLDSELLDQELVLTLKDPISKALSLNTRLGVQFEPELTLIIQLVLYKFSVWDTGATYGAKLQDLKYSLPKWRYLGRVLTPSGLPRKTLLWHTTLTTLLPYLHSRLRSHALSGSWPDAPPNDRRRKIWEWMTTLENVYSLAALVSFVAFLWNGQYRTLADRLLQMRLRASRRLTRRDISYEFMNRQMVWHAFTEFLLFILPFISTRGIQQQFRKMITRITSQISLPSFLGEPPKVEGTGPIPEHRGKYWALPDDQCAICAEDASFNLNLSDPSNAFSVLGNTTTVTEAGDDEPSQWPLNTPYITSCGHLYCYHCIAERVIRSVDEAEEKQWECLRCAVLVSGANRWDSHAQAGDISDNTSDFSFDSDFGGGSMSNMSGSLIYTDSVGSD